MLAAFDLLVRDLVDACRAFYGDRLVSLAVFGSIGRGTPRPDSDVDVLVVADALPDGRVPRVEEFMSVERALAASIDAARGAGLEPMLSPVIKSRDEIQRGSPLLLDMTEDARILHDRDDFLVQSLAALRRRLRALGAKRIWIGNAWIWDLKPDYRPGDIFEL